MRAKVHACKNKRNQCEKNLLSSWLFEIKRREHNNGKGKKYFKDGQNILVNSTTMKEVINHGLRMVHQ